MKGRLRIAAVMMVCLVVIMALPVVAHAASFTSQWPANNATIHQIPGTVLVDVMGAAVKSATITVAGVDYPAALVKGSATGTWSYGEVLDGAVYRPNWSFSPSGTTARTTLYVSPSITTTGTKAVSATGIDSADVSIGTSAWSFTIAANGTNPGEEVEDPAVANEECGKCHDNAAYTADNAMGANCVECHTGLFAPHGFEADSAGGHNTTLFNVQGGTHEFGPDAVVIENDQGHVIEQEWPLPTTGVFWSQSSMTATDSPLVAMDNRGFASAAEGAARLGNP